MVSEQFTKYNEGLVQIARDNNDDQTRKEKLCSYALVTLPEAIQQRDDDCVRLLLNSYNSNKNKEDNKVSILDTLMEDELKEEKLDKDKIRYLFNMGAEAKESYYDYLLVEENDRKNNKFTYTSKENSQKVADLLIAKNANVANAGILLKAAIASNDDLLSTLLEGHYEQCQPNITNINGEITYYIVSNNLTQSAITLVDKFGLKNEKNCEAILDSNEEPPENIITRRGESSITINFVPSHLASSQQMKLALSDQRKKNDLQTGKQY